MQLIEQCLHEFKEGEFVIKIWGGVSIRGLWVSIFENGASYGSLTAFSDDARLIRVLSDVFTIAIRKYRLRYLNYGSYIAVAEGKVLNSLLTGGDIKI